ncbi:hypothetical protein I3843_03G155600 [Carya illinoinensis]|nr:hypothetical protein I3843_03G155600 [Carya illinoinensis]
MLETPLWDHVFSSRFTWVLHIGLLRKKNFPTLAETHFPPSLRHSPFLFYFHFSSIESPFPQCNLSVKPIEPLSFSVKFVIPISIEFVHSQPHRVCLPSPSSLTSSDPFPTLCPLNQPSYSSSTRYFQGWAFLRIFLLV